MTTLVVIPARWGSTRFAGKPLARIAGRTLLHRTIRLARRAIERVSAASLVVATDDERVIRHAREVDCDAILTDPAISSGSGRCLAAARIAGVRPQSVCNLQGDSPFIPQAALTSVLWEIGTGRHDCVTPVIQLDWAGLDAMREQKAQSASSGTTCIRGPDGRAIWFSKAIIPNLRNESVLRAEGPLSPVFRHVGLYCYGYEPLEQFEASEPSVYERLEGLEQLRLIALGIPIHTVPVAAAALPVSGIDTPADARLAESLIERHGDPWDW